LVQLVTTGAIMSVFLYPPWYLRFGVRLAGHLTTPPLNKIEFLELPKQSVLHYVTASPIESGPASDEYIFRNITKPIMVGHISEIGDNKGNPRRLALSPDSMARAYHIQHRRFRLMKNPEAAARDLSTLIVYNYGLIPKMYKYMRSYYTEFYKWHNTQAAVWKNVATVAKELDRNQFLIWTLPTILPSLADLRVASMTVTAKTLKIFNSAESMNLLEMWKWLGPERATSVLANVPDADLDKVNIIFQESGLFYVMNLGRLNRWRIATPEELAINPEANVKGIDAAQLQKRFLRLMMVTMQVRAGITTDPTVEVKDEFDNGVTVDVGKGEIPPEKTAEPQPVVVKQEVGAPTVDKETGAVTTKTKTEPIPIEAVTVKTNVSTDSEEIHHDEEMEKQLDADLAELENISKSVHGDMTEEGKVIEAPVIKEAATLEQGVMSVCDRLADLGQLSAAEYRRFTEISATYRKIVSPNGMETMDKFIAIKPETLVIEESHKFEDISTVPDKTMLKSSLQDFDKSYIKNVLQKDVAGVVMNLQHAGIAVTGYDVEHVETITGNYDHYTVNVKPVEGAPSVLHFRLPTLNEDGTYTANGTKYRMRKQRGD